MSSCIAYGRVVIGTQQCKHQHQNHHNRQRHPCQRGRTSFRRAIFKRRMLGSLLATIVGGSAAVGWLDELMSAQTVGWITMRRTD